MPKQRKSTAGISGGKQAGPTRRGLVINRAAAAAASFSPQRPVQASIVRTDPTTLPPLPLPPGIRSRHVSDINGLNVHVLEAGFEDKGRPCVLLLHGYPEIAYGWRKVMPRLAAAGFHVLAPDMRGYGRTTGWDDSYDNDVFPFRHTNLVRDALGVVHAFGYRSVVGVVGRDAGSPVAAYCALMRPDVFRSVAMMTSPFAGPPALPFNTVDGEKQTPQPPARASSIDDQLAKLNPPRKHYQVWYTTREANDNMLHCPQGLPAFLRAYYHYKSADWKGNKPFRLKSLSAEELAKIPHYYIMDLNKGMAETVAEVMPTAAEIATCRWLTEDELAVYTAEYSRTGFPRAAFGVIAAPDQDAPRTCKPIPAARSTCLRYSSEARAIGASTRIPARSSGCSHKHARTCAPPTSSREPDIG